jgi:hypothetical protein
LKKSNDGMRVALQGRYEAQQLLRQTEDNIPQEQQQHKQFYVFYAFYALGFIFHHSQRGASAEPTSWRQSIRQRMPLSGRVQESLV